MQFQCYVSRASKRQSFLQTFEANDEACAAFAAWCSNAQPEEANPTVYFDKCRGVWVVSNGMRTVTVQVLPAA